MSDLDRSLAFSTAIGAGALLVALGAPSELSGGILLIGVPVAQLAASLASLP